MFKGFVAFFPKFRPRPGDLGLGCRTPFKSIHETCKNKGANYKHEGTHPPQIPIHRHSARGRTHARLRQLTRATGDGLGTGVGGFLRVLRTSFFFALHGLTWIAPCSPNRSSGASASMNTCGPVGANASARNRITNAWRQEAPSHGGEAQRGGQPKAARSQHEQKDASQS